MQGQKIWFAGKYSKYKVQENHIPRKQECGYAEASETWIWWTCLSIICRSDLKGSRSTKQTGPYRTKLMIVKKWMTWLIGSLATIEWVLRRCMRRRWLHQSDARISSRDTGLLWECAETGSCVPILAGGTLQLRQLDSLQSGGGRLNLLLKKTQDIAVKT